MGGRTWSKRNKMRDKFIDQKAALRLNVTSSGPVPGWTYADMIRACGYCGEYACRCCFW